MRKRFERMAILQRIRHSDLNRAATGNTLTRATEALKGARRVSALNAKWTGGLENVYRVLVGEPIEVMCMGIDSVDKEAEGTYTDMSELPAWMQERVAVLSMMKVDPPQTKVEGIGMRVDENVYWVIKGEDNG
jgi:hypothetical protein